MNRKLNGVVMKPPNPNLEDEGLEGTTIIDGEFNIKAVVLNHLHMEGLLP